MRCVVQRVSHASVTVEGELVSKIEKGYMVLLGAEEGDTEADARYCADKIAGLRVFVDADDKMNLSVKDVGGSVLLVSQFTLLGDARHGRRPSFIQAARPEVAEPLCDKVKAMIDALPKPEDVKQSDADAIAAARKAYDALTEEQKRLVGADVLQHLVDDEEALKKKVSYIVYEGEDQVYQQGSGDTISFTFRRSEADETTFSHFNGATNDDIPMTRDKQYSAKSGSVVITLAHDFLEGLEPGRHPSRRYSTTGWLPHSIR